MLLGMSSYTRTALAKEVADWAAITDGQWSIEELRLLLLEQAGGKVEHSRELLRVAS